MGFRKPLLWVLPLNSRNPLKLLVPSYNQKIVSLSLLFRLCCMVINNKIIENEMGYRGSKSITSFIKGDTVKEQRVDSGILYKYMKNAFKEHSSGF